MFYCTGENNCQIAHPHIEGCLGMGLGGGADPNLMGSKLCAGIMWIVRYKIMEIRGTFQATFQM